MQKNGVPQREGKRKRKEDEVRERKVKGIIEEATL